MKKKLYLTLKALNGGLDWIARVADREG